MVDQRTHAVYGMVDAQEDDVDVEASALYAMVDAQVDGVQVRTSVVYLMVDALEQTLSLPVFLANYRRRRL